MEKKLHKNQQLLEDYTAFIQEYKDLGHLEQVHHVPTNHFFLPHHPVIKEESSSTKLRVVFNASRSTTNGRSLNDMLMVGPTIQDDLFDLLLRFRSYTYVLGADITKMFRQVNLHEDDQWFQLILSRSNPDDKIETLKLKTVTYGTAPASFLAIRCLVQLAKDEGQDFPIGRKVLLNDFYTWIISSLGQMTLNIYNK